MPISKLYNLFDARSPSGKTNPAIPFFGEIGYTVTENLQRSVVEGRPDLRIAADNFLVAIRDERAIPLGIPRRIRHGYARHQPRPEEEQEGIWPAKFAVERDLEKWRTFMNSGQKRTLAVYRDKWVCMSPTEFRNADLVKPLKISPRYQRKEVILGGWSIAVTETMPDDWQESTWVKVTFVGDCYEVQGEIEIDAIWDVEAKSWTAGSRDVLADLDLSGHFDDLLADIRRDRAVESENCVSISSSLAVYAFYVSHDHLVTKDESVKTPVKQVGLDEYKRSLERYKDDADTIYRPYFEAGIRKFANDHLISPEWPSLSKLIDTFLAKQPSTFNGKRFGPQEEVGSRQQDEVFDILRQMHGVGSFPIPRDDTNWRKEFNNRQSGSPRRYQPMSELDRAGVEKVVAEYARIGQDALKGAFWRQWEPMFLHEDKEPLETGSTVLASVRSMPTDAVIDLVLSERPEAEELMRQWRDLFDRSFPDWREKRLRSQEISYPRMDSDAEWLKTTFRNSETGIGADTLASIDAVLRREKTEVKADTSGIINDAAMALAIARECEPRGGIIMSPLGSHIVNGCDRDEKPVFEDAFKTTSRNRFHYRLLHRTFEYWNWPFLLKHMGKRLAKTSSHDIGFTLLDMKFHGHHEAVITNFMNWYHVDLSKADTIKDLTLLANSVVGSKWKNSTFFVTEKINNSKYQRFFIIDGRVAASATLDHNLNALDQSPTRLDERVTPIRPGYEGGSVVDRSAAAALARKARRIAVDLKANGILECAVDVAMTDRGPQLIWLNGIDTAGRGTVSIHRYVQAFKRKRMKLAGELRKRMEAHIDTLIEHPLLKAKCLEVIERNAHQMTSVVERQYDLTSQRSSSSDLHPKKFVEVTAASIILTALLELPVPQLDIMEAAE